jgi:glyoxylase-like metal-dependent hydrolase (beta-lactamase superfamily II)
VLDAGLPVDWREFSSALSQVGHTPADVDAVLITHHHPDHAGNAEPLRSHGARVFSHPADAPYLRGEKRMSNRGVVKYLWHPWLSSMTRGRTGPQIIRGAWTEDAELAVRSLDELAATNAETVLAGHGEPWPQGVKSAVDIAQQAAAS